MQGSDRNAQKATPWWRIGMVWLVLGGPAVVVVAGITTAVIAYHGADTVVSDSGSANAVAGKVGR